MQITDKPIINVFGDVVQHKEEHIHYDDKSSSFSEAEEAEFEEVEVSGSDDRKEELHTEDLVSKLKPIFFNNEDDVRQFLKEIAGMKDKDKTDLVNRWVKDKRISDYGNSRKGVLWEILHKAGLYKKTKENWNRRVN